MKKFNQVSQKLSAAVAVGVFAASAFMLSACGGGEFEPSNDEEKQDLAVIKGAHPDAKILSYDAAKKELDSTSSRDFKKCITSNGEDMHYFAKMPSGEIKVFEVYNQEPQLREKPLKNLKQQKIACFED